MMGGKKRVFGGWFHTQFLEGNVLKLEKKDLDKVNKDKSAPNFQVEMYFWPVIEQKSDIEQVDYTVQSLRLLTDGRKMTQYYEGNVIGPNGERQVIKRDVFVWYKGEDGPQGSFYYCEFGMTLSKHQESMDMCIPVHTITAVCVGKQEMIWESPIGQPAVDERCFSIITPTSMLHLEAFSERQLSLWLDGIKYILASSGHRILDEDYVAPVPVPANGSSSNPSSPRSSRIGGDRASPRIGSQILISQVTQSANSTSRSNASISSPRIAGVSGPASSTPRASAIGISNLPLPPTTGRNSTSPMPPVPSARSIGYPSAGGAIGAGGLPTTTSPSPSNGPLSAGRLSGVGIGMGTPKTHMSIKPGGTLPPNFTLATPPSNNSNNNNNTSSPPPPPPPPSSTTGTGTGPLYGHRVIQADENNTEQSKDAGRGLGMLAAAIASRRTTGTSAHPPPPPPPSTPPPNHAPGSVNNNGISPLTSVTLSTPSSRTSSATRHHRIISVLPTEDSVPYQPRQSQLLSSQQKDEQLKQQQSYKSQY